MRAPLCFCNGVVRSGSTWSFNVCRALFQELAASRRQAFGSAYLDGPYVEQFVGWKWAQAPGPTVIKAHMIGPMAMHALRTGEAKAVCTFRDPRDCVASDLIFMGGGLEHTIQRVNGSLEFLKHYQNTPHILLVRYEDMMADRLGQIRRIARHLNINLDDSAAAKIDEKTNLESSKRLCSELKHRSSDQVLNIQSHRVDPETHLHEHHIGNARIGRWRDELSADQARWLTEYFAHWLLQLGYETQDSLKAILATPRRSDRVPQSTANTVVPANNLTGVFSMGAARSGH